MTDMTQPFYNAAQIKTSHHAPQKCMLVIYKLKIYAEINLKPPESLSGSETEPKQNHTPVLATS
jgi:hypothetical protein